MIDAREGPTENTYLGIIANGLPNGMSPEPNAIEQAVARALRDSLERIQRNNNDLAQAISDVVAACSSSKPTNALPPMLRAQASAASLSAALEVLSRFIALTLQAGVRSSLEERIVDAIGVMTPEAPAAPARPAPSIPAPQAATVVPAASAEEPSYELEPVIESTASAEPEPVPPGLEPEAGFNIDRLTVEEQELHRRANRVAKVSMQDIKMLRPEQVKLGRQNRDLCIRLKEDIEKAHREYDSRFKPIMDHPVDYFYRWMVEILADGDAAALGEYPYVTTGKTR